MARPKSPTKTVHTAVRLPAEIHRRLSAAGRGRLAEEIKERLEISFELEQLDEPTHRLLVAVINMSRMMAQEGHDWHSSSFRRATLSAAIAAWLETQFSGTPSKADARAGTRAASLWLKKGYSPKEAGHALQSLACSVFGPLSALELWDPRKDHDESKKGHR